MKRIAPNAPSLGHWLRCLVFLPATTALAQVTSFTGLIQQCQFGTTSAGQPTVSPDTPTASIANNFNWIVEVANSQISVFSHGGTQSWRENLSGAPSGWCSSTRSFFDPLNATRVVDNRVLYDRTLQRFCITGMQQDSQAAGSGTQGIYVAWTNSDNPTVTGCGGGAGWRKWVTPMPIVPAPGQYQPDFNGMGQTSTHVVWSGILQPLTFPSGPSYTFIRMFLKSSMNGPGIPAQPTYVDLPPIQRLTSEFMQAADSFDPTPTAYLCATDIANSRVRLVAVPPGATAETPFFLPVAPYVAAVGGAPQLSASPPSFLDALDGRMQSAVLRDDFLYCCHTIQIGSGSTARMAVRWYQIAMRGWPTSSNTPLLVQSGTIDLGTNGAGNPVYAFLPSLAVNALGNLFFTFARSAVNERPSVCWAARHAWDPIGTTTLGGTQHASSASYLSSNGIPGNPQIERWGDWTSTVVDANGEFEWFLSCGDYATTLGTTCFPNQGDRWETWIGRTRVQNVGWFQQYGVGTSGTTGIPAITGLSAQPRIATTVQVNTTNSAGAPTVGLGIVSLAIDPSGVGGQGTPSPIGTLWVDPNQATSISYSLSTQGGQFPLVFPLDPAFIGRSLFLQAAIVDGGNPTSFAVTNGTQILCGS